MRVLFPLYDFIYTKEGKNSQRNGKNRSESEFSELFLGRTEEMSDEGKEMVPISLDINMQHCFAQFFMSFRACKFSTSYNG
jgi:hypothetical protein